MEEIEIKFLDVNVPELRKKIEELGGTHMGDFNYRRIMFDYPDFRLNAAEAFIRLRDEGNKVTLAFKQQIAPGEAMYERETVVEDFDAVRDIFLKAGFVEKMYQENKRTRYMLNGVECDIDSWPLIPTYLELEGPSWERVYEVAELLGFNKEDAKKFTANGVYKLHGLDDRNFVKLTFNEQIERTENRF